MAAKYWPNQDPLGKRLQLPRGKDFLQIVGVVKTANYQSLGEAPQSCIYIPLRQHYSDAMILYVRTERDPSATLAAVQGEIRTLDPGLPVEDIRTGTKLIDQALWGAKIGVSLLGVFWTVGPEPRVRRLVRFHGVLRESAAPGNRCAHGFGSQRR